MASRLLVLIAFVLGIGAALAQTPPNKIKCEDSALPAPAARARSIGGVPAAFSAWPWFATLRVNDEAKKVSLAFCGGAFIAPNWVLTAGHCVHYIDKSSMRTDYYGAADPSVYPMNARLEVVAGVDDLRGATAGNIYAVERIVMHPDYEVAYKNFLTQQEPSLPDAVGKDLALVKVASPWKGPFASLASNPANDLPADASVKVAGFGTVEVQKDWQGKFRGKLRKYPLPAQETLHAGCARLMQVTMPVVNSADCHSRYLEPNFDPAIGDEQICAGFEHEDQDSCNGDSGGPLVVTGSDGQTRQVGIVSWGTPNCAGEKKSYGVYTRVAKFAEWISKTTGASQIEVGATARARLATPAKPFSTVALGDLEIDLALVKGKVRVGILGGPVVQLGSDYTLSVESDVDGQLILIDVDAAGKVTQVFPNKYVSSASLARISAGTPLAVPSPGWGFSGFRATEPLGDGKLIAVVVPNGFPLTTIESESAEQATKGLVPVQKPNSYVMNLVQQVAEVTARSRAAGASIETSWAFNSVPYKIVKE